MKFENGDLIFVRKRGFSLFGAAIRNQQRDFNYEHVCQWFNGLIYSTGVSGFPFYRFGPVPANEYLKGRDYAVGRFKDLTPGQKNIMLATVKTFTGRKYALGKVIRLAIRGRFSSKVVGKLGPGKVDKNPKKLFCAEAVALTLHKAGIPLEEINPKYPSKRDPAAFTPEVLYDSPRIKPLCFVNDGEMTLLE